MNRADEPVPRPYAQALIQDFFDARTRGDVDVLREVLSSDIVWWPPRSARDREVAARPVRGAAALIDHLTAEDGHGSPLRRWMVERVIVEGTRVAVRARVRSRSVAIGEPYEGCRTYVMRLDWSHIVEVWEDSSTVIAPTGQARAPRCASSRRSSGMVGTRTWP